MRYILSFLLLISTLSADKTCEKIVEYIFKNLPESGTIKQDQYGFVYVDIDDRYIKKLIPFIEDEGFEQSAYFGPGLHGAHISIIYANEAEYYQIGTVEEVGTPIYFKIKGCKTVIPPNKPGEIDYLLTIDAPSLTKLRKKYGLPSPRFDFHITIGRKNSENPAFSK